MADGSDTHRPPLYTCRCCLEPQPRPSFPKKTFREGVLECRGCRVAARASRVGQQRRPGPQQRHGRIAASGAVRRPNNFGYCDYVDRLFGLRCFRDIACLGAFTSAKDVSESMAALHGACRHGTAPRPAPREGGGAAVGRDGDEVHNSGYGRKRDVLCLCVGDGSTPRTAVLAAFTKPSWLCASIDPALRDEWRGTRPGGVRGLIGYGGALEDFAADGEIVAALASESGVPEFRYLVVLCVHSHARFRGSCSVPDLRAKFGGLDTTIVSLPCCAGFRHVGDIGRAPDVHYDDDCVFSACRTVEIWNFASERGDSTSL